jgi:hypothetical protein
LDLSRDVSFFDGRSGQLGRRYQLLTGSTVYGNFRYGTDDPGVHFASKDLPVFVGNIEQV